jgi:hypothetical protein
MSCLQSYSHWVAACPSTPPGLRHLAGLVPLPPWPPVNLHKHHPQAVQVRPAEGVAPGLPAGQPLLLGHHRYREVAVPVVQARLPADVGQVRSLGVGPVAPSIPLERPLHQAVAPPLAPPLVPAAVAFAAAVAG